MANFNQAANRPFSLRLNLVLLVLACVLPAAMVSALLLYANFRLEKTNVEHQTALVAKSVVSDLDRDMAAVESALKTLATSQELASGNLAGFHARASQALTSGIVYNYVLTDPAGRQVLNTLQPYGAALPSRGTPTQLAAVFTLGSTVLTDMFTGPVTGQPAIAMGVPVVVNGEVKYSLNIGLSPDRIQDMVARHALPEGWLMAVLDSNGTIVGRSRDVDRFLGQKAVPELRAALAQGAAGNLYTVTKEGIPVFTAYAASHRWRWGVAVGAPTSVLQENLFTRLWQVGAGLLLAVGLGLGFARSVVLKVLSSVTGLNTAALALVRGDPVELPRIQLQEAEAVGDAILQASAVMRQAQFMAQHDALTGLPNRRLFDDFAQRHLSLAHRQARPLVLLAVDLDGFKAVNDSQGHAAGDAVLKTAAQRLQESVRASDMVARVGGDEFVVMLYGVGEEDALDMARRMVELLSQAYPGVASPVSASVGVAVWGGETDTLKRLNDRADHALYLAKQRGKRQAVLADPEPVGVDRS
jgi:diguanylate cyclase (GGDEF)-like protein